MITHFKKRKKEGLSINNFWGIAAIVVILAIIGYLIVANVRVNKRKDKINDQLQNLQKEIGDFNEKNESLKEGILKVGDEDYVEKVAREDLGLQKEGEKVVGFILPEQKAENTNNDFWNPKTWWQKFKDFFD